MSWQKDLLTQILCQKQMEAVIYPNQLERSFSKGQLNIAYDLGWLDKLSAEGVANLIKCIDSAFSEIITREPVSVRLPQETTVSKEGRPFYALNNQFSLEVSRRYVNETPVFKSNFEMMQASENYQASLLTLIRYLTKSNHVSVFSKVKRLPETFNVADRRILLFSAAESDVFIPTGLSRGASRHTDYRLNDSGLFESIVSDYIKVMKRIQKPGYDLCTHFFLIPGRQIKPILDEPETAMTLWEKDEIRDYRRVRITCRGEVILQFKEEVFEEMGRTSKKRKNEH